MVGQSSSLASAISSASVPELKDVLRKISSGFLSGKETVTRFLGSLKGSEQNDIALLRNVVLQVCGELENVRDAVMEALADNEEEISLGQQLLDDTEEPGYESIGSLSSERQEASKKRKWKWKMDTAPRSESKKTKSTEIVAVNGINRSIAIPKKAKSQLGPNTEKKENLTPPISMSQKKKMTATEYFAADAARRVREEQEEIARIKEIQASWTVDSDFGIATCARCKHYYEKGENTNKSCVFHSGVRRNYHFEYEEYVRGDRWFCCGRSQWEEECMESKHIDNKTPGISEKLARQRRLAVVKAMKVLFGRCENCREDVEVNQNGHRYDCDDDTCEEERLLCEPCEEEEKKVETECAGCGLCMRISPDDWSVDQETWCEECEEHIEERRHDAIMEGTWCEDCEREFDPPADEEEEYENFDPNASRCLACQIKGGPLLY